jgi:pimeloyl-ACP methyl ester carboxylesterase
LEAFFFGSKGRQLFGVYHEAAGSGHGVVLANPGPQESMQTHYAFRLLAAQFARAGCPALRFDWGGTGDSAGDSETVSLQQWRDDLQMAVQELKDISNARRFSIVGFRLGATVAASTPFAQVLEELVLWEPVISGRDYLEELNARERRKFGDLLEPPSWWRQGRAHELLGHTMSSAHYAEIEALDLTQQAAPAARRICIVTNKMTLRQQSLVAALKERGIETALDEVGDVESQVRDDGMLLAGAAISRITDRLKAV